MLKKANEPLYILRNLRKLGTLDLVAHLDGLPELTELEADHPHIWWTGTLQTSAPRAQIDEVFEFVVDDCDLEIVDTTPAADPAGVPESVSAVVACDRGAARCCPTAGARSARRKAGIGGCGQRTRRGGACGSKRHRQSGRHHHPNRTGTNRSRREHGGRIGDRSSHARADRPGIAGRHQRPLVANSRRGHPSYARTEGQRHVHARAAGGFGVPADASACPRTVDQDGQESPAGNGRRDDRSRSVDHRAAGRSVDAHHPQFGRPRHRIAGRPFGRRKERGRYDPAFGRASRRSHRHRDQGRWRWNQFRARAQEGAGKGLGQRRRHAHRR